MNRTKSTSGLRKAEDLLNVIAVGVFLAIVASAPPAWAALGGDVTSVAADQAQMQGTRRVTAAESYNIHEIQAATGTTVREYVSQQGKVFGVAWQGPWPPNMRQLLGRYFDQFAQAVKTQNSSRIGRRPLFIELPGLIVQVSGHGRYFTGRAYSPDRLPSSVSAEAIR